MDASVTVAIIEDHPFTREGLASWFTKSGNGIRVIATGKAFADVYLPPFSDANVVLLDLNLEGGRVGTSEVERLVATGKRVVILTEDTRDETYYSMILAGAFAVLTKNCAPNECVNAILNAYNGEPYLGRNAAHAIANDARTGRPRLSDRELEAVRLTCFGWDQRTAADRMGIKPETVKTYLARAYLKYAHVNRPASDRHTLTIRALEDGTVTLSELVSHADLGQPTGQDAVPRQVNTPREH